MLYLGCGVRGTGCSAVFRVWGGRHRVQCCIEDVGCKAQGAVLYLGCGVGGTGCSAVFRVWGGRHRVQCCI